MFSPDPALGKDPRRAVVQSPFCPCSGHSAFDVGGPSSSLHPGGRGLLSEASWAHQSFAASCIICYSHLWLARREVRYAEPVADCEGQSSSAAAGPPGTVRTWGSAEEEAMAEDAAALITSSHHGSVGFVTSKVGQTALGLVGGQTQEAVRQGKQFC